MNSPQKDTTKCTKKTSKASFQKQHLVLHPLAGTTREFPDNFFIAVSDTSAYKQFGNSVAVPAIQATAKEIKRIKLSKSIPCVISGK